MEWGEAVSRGPKGPGTRALICEFEGKWHGQRAAFFLSEG